jgi:chemotaxis protein methyltransferase WspC
MYLKHNRIDAEAYLLLGQIYQAGGNEEQAEQYFQKVIYLQPNHEDALMHLRLLKENRRDFAGADVIQQRIQRLQKPPDQ